VDTLITTLVDGNLLAAVPIALLAGLVSFASPCILPLVPGYIGFVGGAADAHTRRGRLRMVAGWDRSSWASAPSLLAAGTSSAPPGSI
jgi:cytochrome c-type biogenesis protein